MGFKKHQFVGLATPVYLPDDITVEIAIVPASVTNVRSNQAFSGQTSATYHETANFNTGANADMHRRWLHGGAGGSSVGFNFVVDDRKIIQLTPLDEVTWAAGTADGNRYSWHVEQCVNADADLVKARRNTSYLMAGLCAAKGWNPRSAVVQHNVWYGKNCPLVIRRDGLWPVLQNLFAERTEEAKRAASGTVEKPRTVDFLVPMMVRTTPGFWDTANNKPNVIKTLPAGTTGTVINGPVEVGGVDFYDLKIDGFGTGWVAKEILNAIQVK
jgi:N-acetylmuramoyl-L-alanine amidase